MQNDFIDGSLGTAEAVAIVDNVKRKIEEYKANQITQRYTLTKYNTTYKCKKDRKTGELTDEFWLVSITKEYEVM